MLIRVLAATLCLAAGAAAWAVAPPEEVPLVLGDSVVEVDPADTDAPAGDTDPPPPDDVSIVAEDGAGGEMPAVADMQPAVAWFDQTDDWYRETTVDALFIERANTAGPLAVQSAFTADPGATVIAASDVRYPVAPGVRVFQAWRQPDCRGVEVGYLGVWGMHADALATSPDGSIALPGEIGLEPDSGFDAATAIRPVVSGNLNSFEINVFATRCHDGCRRHDPLPWRRVGVVTTADWLLGARWAALDETATLDVTAQVDDSPPAFNTTRYRVTSNSQLVGPQIGHRRRFEWGDWAVEGWAKATLAASLLTQSQSSVIRPFDLEPVRGPQSGSWTGVGMIGDVNMTAVRRFGDHWGLRAGYTLLWFSGVAPAANQWNFTLDPAGGRAVVVDTVFLHGATLGLEATW